MIIVSASKWDEKFLDMTNLVASWSKDRSTKVGAVIVKNHRVLATGYNGFPIGCDDDNEDRHQRPTKYLFTEHAERNAIYSAAKHGISLDGATMYLLWELPCADCARAIIQSGIKHLRVLNKSFPGKNIEWDAHFKAAKEMLEEADVFITKLEGYEI